MGTLKPVLFIAVLLASSWYSAVRALGRHERAERRRKRAEAGTARHDSGARDHRGDAASVALVVGMATMVAIVAVVALTSRQLPQWFLWAATVF